MRPQGHRVVEKTGPWDLRQLHESCWGESLAQETQGAMDPLFSSPLYENAERRKSMNEMRAVGELHLWITFAGVCPARAWPKCSLLTLAILPCKSNIQYNI